MRYDRVSLYCVCSHSQAETEGNTLQGKPTKITVCSNNFKSKGSQAKMRLQALVRLFPEECFMRLHTLLLAAIHEGEQVPRMQDALSEMAGEGISVNWYEACVIPEDVNNPNASRQHTARAAVSFHGAPYISNVACNGENEEGEPEEWYAKVIAFFEVKTKNGEVLKKAFVRWYMEVPETDFEETTMLPTLRWASTNMRDREEFCALLDIDVIRNVVHVVPQDWSGADSYFTLNLDKDL